MRVVVEMKLMSDERDTFSTMLGETGLRTTKARLLILEHLADRTDHPTAENILRSLRDQGHELGPATLYQNLGKLADAGLVLRLSGPDGLMHFDARTDAHPHLACVVCGSIVDAEVDEALLRKLKPKCPHSGRPLNDWKLEDVQVELKGICPACQTVH